MPGGYIKVYRDIWENELWLEEVAFSRRDAWIDLILMANFRGNSIVYAGRTISVERGQIYTSIRKLSDRWHWSKDKTLRYINLLEELGMVRRDKSVHFATLLTIVNYGKFQDSCDSDKDTNKDTHKDKHKDTDEPLHKKEKNDKESKEYIATQFTPEMDPEGMTDEEFEAWQKWRIENGII